MDKITSICQFLLHFWRATREFLITIIISFVPVLLGAVVASCWSDISLAAAFLSNFKYGEVFLYTSAFLAPYAHKKLRRDDNLPSILIFVFALFSFVVGAFAFSFVRLENILSKKMAIPPDSITYIGSAIIISTIVVWYYSVWQDHKLRTDPNKANKDQQDDLNKNFESLMGEK
ncbi:hypothetical protein [Rahnella aceris]